MDDFRGEGGEGRGREGGGGRERGGRGGEERRGGGQGNSQRQMLFFLLFFHCMLIEFVPQCH